MCLLSAACGFFMPSLDPCVPWSASGLVGCWPLATLCGSLDVFRMEILMWNLVIRIYYYMSFIGLIPCALISWSLHYYLGNEPHVVRYAGFYAFFNLYVTLFEFGLPFTGHTYCVSIFDLCTVALWLSLYLEHPSPPGWLLVIWKWSNVTSVEAIESFSLSQSTLFCLPPHPVLTFYLRLFPC